MNLPPHTFNSHDGRVARILIGLSAGMQTEQGTGATAVPSTPPRPTAEGYCITASTGDYTLPNFIAGITRSKHRAGHRPSPHHEARKQAARKRQRKARRK